MITFIFDSLSSNAGLQDIVEEIIIRKGIYEIFTYLLYII